ncbi:hypothetical protein BCR36DRAFT_272299 [Piromyces finnis]|uniref:Thioredoxin domain-containing protein n=1 Tax=Piromyces finnis TaxID=1754191 RepID=A0A1Y1VNC7_9FUNG|nr:hypothetical protein BCR36DRAFT_272299 [Piromyces finnis]|eukprot:ORX60927.1 hypothetical protein BCR36DRAFT_272299 [Piromyces finnis]
MKHVFSSVYSKYADKIKSITEAKDKERETEFEIQESLGIERIDSTNYQKLYNGTWLVQIYSPWCPYSLHFQKTWKDVVKDVKKINELLLSGKMSLDENEKKSSESTDNSIVEKDKKEEELKIKKRLIIKDLKFAQINAYESVDVSALLEVKEFPTIKVLHKGNAVTYTNSTSYKKLVKFAVEDWMNQEWYNRLPKSPSKLYQTQLKISLTLNKILV